MGAVCDRCGHVGHQTRAVGRFRQGGPAGYVGPEDGTLRTSRAEAEHDVCDRQREQREDDA